jgi:hypothetical protein
MYIIISYVLYWYYIVYDIHDHTDMEQSTCKNYDLINILLHEKEQHTFYNLLKASKRIFPVLIISFHYPKK